MSLIKSLKVRFPLLKNSIIVLASTFIAYLVGFLFHPILGRLLGPEQYGLFGVALGIIALVLSGKAKALYNENPDNYTISSYKNMNAGRICGLIGTILSSLVLVFWIIYFIVIGAALGTLFTQLPWDSF